MSYPTYDRSECDRVHITPYETGVINCAKAFVRALRRFENPRSRIHDEEIAKRHEKALRLAVEKLEADEERTRTKRRELADLDERIAAEADQQPRRRKKSQKAKPQKSKQAPRIPSKRPGVTTRSYRSKKGDRRTNR